MPKPDFYVKTGDLFPPISRTLEDATGAAVDIHTATGVEFQMRPIGGGSVLGGSAVVLAGGSTGSVRYDWTAGDTDMAGFYLAEWEVHYGGGITETFPNGGYDVVLITEAI